MNTDTIVTVSGNDAIDIAMGAPSDSIIMESNQGYKEGIGDFERPAVESDMETLLWTLLRFRLDPQRVAVLHHTNPRTGYVDWAMPISVVIETGGLPEWSTTTFTINPE